MFMDIAARRCNRRNCRENEPPGIRYPEEITVMTDESYIVKNS